MTNRTFTMIKPDAVQNGHIGSIINHITKAGFKIKGKINRFDYNLKWNTLTEAGGATVGETVEFTSNLELAQVKPASGGTK